MAASLVAQTFDPASIPNPKEKGSGYVSDPDNILSQDAKNLVNQLCARIEDSTTVQIGVVLLQSIGAQNPKEFTTALFNLWGIGDASNDNGLLILTVMDQRRTEFETGYGLEGVLPDVICYRIGMQELVPYFREGQYGEGVRATLERIERILLDPDARAEVQAEMRKLTPKTGLRAIPLPLVIYGGLMLLWALFTGAWTFVQLKSKQELHDKYLGIRRLHWLGWTFIFPILFIPIYLITRSVLKKLRNQPRFSRINGKPMNKLSEADDDAFLEIGQVVEEQIGSVDYDVWVTEEKDDALILSYKKRFSKYKTCPSCSFRTYYHARTETLRKATSSRSGRGVHIYECKNCHYTKRDEFTISKKSKGGIGISGGGSSGGGSSWGGGSSGGGGAGVSW